MRTSSYRLMLDGTLLSSDYYAKCRVLPLLKHALPGSRKCKLPVGLHFYPSSPFSCSNRSKPRYSWYGHTNFQYINRKGVESLIAVKPPIEFAATMKEKVKFGILFDIDGVIARGSTPLNAAKRMIKLLCDKDGELTVPIAFCTNSTGVAADKAKCLSSWLSTEVRADQVIAAQGPLAIFEKFHHKRVLFVGQGKINEIAKELGFTNVVTIDEVKDAFPLLDIVDHSNRAFIAKNGINSSHIREDFKPIEAIVLIGEPNKWETQLQLLVDLLLTGGYPAFAPEGGFPKTHLPIIACNMDLVFMAEACMPRFGHGAFLVCLESLYKKITGQDLQYTALIGKPSEITFRFAEHCIANTARRLGIEQPIETLYIVGDNPEVDVFGANLYTKYIEDCMRSEDRGGPHSSRQVPSDYDFGAQTVTKCHSILVETGVYDPKIGRIEDEEMDVYHHGHRDFEANMKLRIPTQYCTDVYDAVLNILEKELHISDHLNNNDDGSSEKMSDEERQQVMQPRFTGETGAVPGPGADR